MLTLTKRQTRAIDLQASAAMHVMLEGGTRSGKTVIHVRSLISRALMVAETNHAMLRFRFNHARATLAQGTIPFVVKEEWPALMPIKWDSRDAFWELPNGSRIWLGGLDDKERTEKILGAEYSTLLLNECSQIPYSSRNLAVTRVAENRGLRPKIYYDCVSGDTVLPGYTHTIAELAQSGEPIMALTSHGWRQASAPWMSGYGPMLTVEFSNGASLKVTPSHRFWTRKGWRRADTLQVGDTALCLRPEAFDDRLDARHCSETASDWTRHCYRCRSRYGGPPPLEEGFGPAYPASSSGAEARIQSTCYGRDLSDSRTGRLSQRGVLHNQNRRSSRNFYGSFGDELLCEKEPFCEEEIFGLSRKTLRFSPPSLGSSSLLLQDEESDPWFHSKGICAGCLAASLDQAAIGKQLSQSNRKRWLSQDRYSLLTIDHGIDLSASDTPLFSSCAMTEVISVSQASYSASYTIDVPGCNHYSVGGLLSHNCNPPSKAHWSYKLFHEHKDPISGKHLTNPDNYVCLRMNPRDNAENLSQAFMSELQEMGAKDKKRFWDGEYADISEGAMWTVESIEVSRVAEIPEMLLIVVAVDPSGASGPEDSRSDEIGIVVVGLGVDSHAYVLEDSSLKAGPAQWASVACGAYDRWQANRIVAEENFGGAMVSYTIKAHRQDVPVTLVNASRGKVVRAEPISTLFDAGKVHMYGSHPKLEDQMTAMTMGGYTGERSPDRLDAMVWGISHIFPSVTKKESPMARPPQVVMGRQSSRPAVAVNTGRRSR